MKQFIKFGLVGVSNTVVSYVIYAVSLFLMRRFGLFPKADYLIAQVLMFLLSILWSFYWNSRFVFVRKEEEKRSWWKVLLKTYAAYSFTGLFLSSILLVFWTQVLHVSSYIAPLLNLVINVPLNFLINKYWAFAPES